MLRRLLAATLPATIASLPWPGSRSARRPPAARAAACPASSSSTQARKDLSGLAETYGDELEVHVFGRPPRSCVSGLRPLPPRRAGRLLGRQRLPRRLRPRPTGFDPAYSSDRPGGYLLMRLIEDLSADPTVNTLDFGFGDAVYKRQLGDEHRLEEDVAAFAPTVRAVSVNATRTALHGATRVAKSILARSGRLTILKRRWRGRLADGNGR